VRFTSPYAQYKVTALKDPDSIEWLANGQWRPKDGKQQPFICRFEPNAYTMWERDEALRYFGDVIRLGQRKTDATLTTDSPLGWRIGTYDTDQIEDPVLRKKVEEALLNHERYGHSFMHFPKPKAPAPWKNYDRVRSGGPGNTKYKAAEEIVRIAEEIGADPGAVMAYEAENANRPEVLEALERWAAKESDEDEITVSA
jgi:hypothetical protein